MQFWARCHGGQAATVEGMCRISILPPSLGGLSRKQVCDGLPHPRLGMEKWEEKSSDREAKGGGAVDISRACGFVAKGKASWETVPAVTQHTTQTNISLPPP